MSRNLRVAWCSIHRWTPQALLHLLGMLHAEHNRLQGQLADTAGALTGGDRKAQVVAQKRHDQLVGLRSELASFILQVQDIAERGALWPLLLPQGWKDPNNWWVELCNASGKKDYDWSQLAARYFPTRVDRKCQQDPSLALGHFLFRKYHPEKARELRLAEQRRRERKAGGVGESDQGELDFAEHEGDDE